MFSRRGIKLLLIVFFLFLAGQASSYDTEVAHPFLTQKAVELFNSETREKITEQELAWIIQGAKEEDTPIRWMNHFYNPETGRGLLAFASAKDWTGQNLKQSLYPKGNQTWQKAIESYAKGDEKGAFIALGHNLHLIEDMAVPAHTRDDIHPTGDPYESWVKNNTSNKFDKISFVKFNNLEEYFNSLANYSNKYFFSQDTIKADDFYQEIIIDKKVYLLSKDDTGKRLKLVEKVIIAGKTFYYLTPPVHSGYYSLLAPKAISYGAGMIDLFFEEAEKKKEEEVKESLLDKLKSIISPLYPESIEINRYNPVSLNEAEEEIVEKIEEIVGTVAEEGGKVLSAKVSTDDLFKPGQTETSDNNSIPPPLPLSDKIETREENKIGIARVIDGDTIVLTTGEKVRYIGIDAPELGEAGPADDECLAWVARLRNKELLSKGELKLVKDKAVDKDKYGRLLRYVYTGNVFVNGQLALEGLAETFFCQPGWENCPVTSDESHQQIILSASDSAKRNKRGLFSGVCELELIKEEEEPLLKLDFSKNDNELDSIEVIEDEAPQLYGGQSSQGFIVIPGNDTIPPITTILDKPTNPTNLTSAEFKFFASEEIADFYCQLDSGEWQDCVSPASYTDLDSGQHIFKVRATDLSGNIEANPAEYEWEIDLSLPSIPLILWPADFPYYASSTPLVISGSNDDDLEILINNSNADVVAVDDTDWQSSLSLVEGENIFYLKSRNQFGVESGEDDFTIILDVVAPVVNIISGPVNFASSTIANFSFSSDEENIIFQYQLDSGGWQDYNASTTISGLVADGHSLEVRGLDPAGNISSSTVYNWLVDITVPTSTVANLAESYSSTGFTISWGGNDTASTTGSGIAGYDVQYKIESGDWQAWISATSSTEAVFDIAVETGKNIYFRARARDKAGNIGGWSDKAQTVIATNQADHIVISEVSLGVNDAEWIELYNPTIEDMNLINESVYLSYFSSGKNWNEPYKPAVSKRQLSGVIPAKGFYLIRIDGTGATSIPDYDWDYSGSANTLNDSAGSVAIFPWDPATKTIKEAKQGKIDAVGWGDVSYVKEGDSAIAPGANQSLERKAAATSTAATMSAGGAHEWQGNGYDSDNNSEDFVIRNIPEPRDDEPIIPIELDDLAIWHFDENSGSVAYDSTANHNDLSWGHNPSGEGKILPERQEGKWDLGINFSQKEELLSKNFSPAISWPDGLTVGLWLKTDLNTADYARIFWAGNTLNYASIPDNHFMLSVNQGRVKLSVKQNNVWQTEIVSPGFVNDNHWHFVTLKFAANGKATLFIDGQYQAERDYILPIPDLEVIVVGKREDYWAPYSAANFKGIIDDIWIKTRALSDQEISQIYASGQPYKLDVVEPSPAPVEIKAYYPFDEAAGNTAFDQSGNGYDLNWDYNPWGGGQANPRWINGKFAGGINFKKVEDLFSRLNAPAIDFSQGAVVGVWIKTQSSSAVPARFFVWGSDEQSSVLMNSLVLSEVGGKINFSLNYFDGTSGPKYFYRNYNLTSARTINDNNWHFVAVVLDPRPYNHKAWLYINGEPEGEIFFPSPLPLAQEMKVGYRENYHAGQQANFSGDVDDLFILSSIISDEEVEQIYESNRAFTWPPVKEPL